MTRNRNSRPLTFQVTVSVIMLAVFSLAMMAAVGIYAVLRADANALSRQQIFMASGLAEQVEALVREQRSVAVWDDSVINAKAGNQDWMRENLGEWLYSYYGHDRVYVLDQNDRPVHAMRDGKTLVPPVYQDDAEAIRPSVEALRQSMRALAGGDTTAAAEIEDTVLLGQTPALLSIMPLVPASTRVSQSPGSEFLHVSIQLVDASLIAKIAEHYGLAGAGFSPTQPGARAAIPMRNHAGVTLGYLTWEPDRPGLNLVREAGPAVTCGILLAFGMLVFLLRRLRRASTQLQRSQNEAQYLAFHDTLTGLPNRALFEDRIRRALVSVTRGRGKIALICLDLDRFKHVNDTFGHPAGDELVRQTAARLSNAVREVDTVARLGGDEFAIILVDIRNLRTAEDLCERLLQDLGLPFQLGSDQVFISASIGIAVSPDFGADPDELLRKADIALYEAKKAGRGRYQVFAGDMDDVLLRRRVVEGELRAALAAEDGISLMFQPVHASDGTTLVGAEGLLDWDHPAHGALPAAQLIGIAEERGMIGQLTETMLRSACDLCTRSVIGWVAVPMSPVFLRDEHAAEKVLRVLAETDLVPSRLQLDVVEGAFLDAADSIHSTIQTLRQAGVSIAVDDFGTGHASLASLRRHPVDKLKLDRSFVQMLGPNESALAFVRSLIALAGVVGMEVEAAGVETVEQRDILRAMGCREMQGPLFSPPLSALHMQMLADGRPELLPSLATAS